jgi:deazaflavin-dependent oxidoreductase (nitroreductase family)
MVQYLSRQQDHQETSFMNDRNRTVIDDFRANKGIVSTHTATHNIALITTTGSKTGAQRTTPLVYHKDGDRVIIVASKGGAPEHPSWYHNLVKNPTVTVEVGEEKYEARAEVAQGEERDRLYRQQAALFESFNDYEKRTTRKIPVVILTRQ